MLWNRNFIKAALLSGKVSWKSRTGKQSLALLHLALTWEPESQAANLMFLWTSVVPSKIWMPQNEIYNRKHTDTSPGARKVKKSTVLSGFRPISRSKDWQFGISFPYSQTVWGSFLPKNAAGIWDNDFHFLLDLQACNPESTNGRQETLVSSVSVIWFYWWKIHKAK